MSCGRERRAIEYLSNEKIRLEALVSRYKNDNEEYLKIKEAAQEKVKDVLTNSKLLLQFATLSVIESLRRNPELCNFILSDDIYSALLLEETEKLYKDLTTKLTNTLLQQQLLGHHKILYLDIMHKYIKIS
jgi:hypothetical protein